MTTYSELKLAKELNHSFKHIKLDDFRIHCYLADNYDGMEVRISWLNQNERLYQRILYTPKFLQSPNSIQIIKDNINYVIKTYVVVEQYKNDFDELINS